MSRFASETLSPTTFEDRFSPYVLTVVSQFNVILTKKKTLLFKFLWLEFRFKLFLELHAHFKYFMCIRMRTLHEECQVRADAHDCGQIGFSAPPPACPPPSPPPRPH